MGLRLVGISDTHSYHRKVNVPDGDVLIHGGDISWRGEMTIIEDFAAWMKEQPHKHKVAIFGNHETLAYPEKKGQAISFLKEAGVHYLEDSFVEIEGVKFYGSPYTPTFGSWAFMLPRHLLKEKWKLIDPDVVVLITHGPPFGILDWVPRGTHAGCEELLARIRELPKLKAMISGHLHSNGGQVIEKDGVIFGNAAICNESYDPIQSPIVINL